MEKLEKSFFLFHSLVYFFAKKRKKRCAKGEFSQIDSSILDLSNGTRLEHVQSHFQIHLSEQKKTCTQNHLARVNCLYSCFGQFTSICYEIELILKLKYGSFFNKNLFNSHVIHKNDRFFRARVHPHCLQNLEAKSLAKPVRHCTRHPTSLIYKKIFVWASKERELTTLQQEHSSGT